MLNSQDFLHCLFDRLPYRLKSQFVTATLNKDFTSFVDLSLLVEKAAAEANSDFDVLLHKSKEGTGPNSRFFRSGYSRPRQVCVAQQVTKIKENERDTTFKDNHPHKTEVLSALVFSATNYIGYGSVYHSKVKPLAIEENLLRISNAFGLTAFREVIMLPLAE